MTTQPVFTMLLPQDTDPEAVSESPDVTSGPFAAQGEEEQLQPRAGDTVPAGTTWRGPGPLPHCAGERPTSPSIQTSQYVTPEQSISHHRAQPVPLLTKGGKSTYN